MFPMSRNVKHKGKIFPCEDSGQEDQLGVYYRISIKRWQEAWISTVRVVESGRKRQMTEMFRSKILRRDWWDMKIRNKDAVGGRGMGAPGQCWTTNSQHRSTRGVGLWKRLHSLRCLWGWLTRPWGPGAVWRRAGLSVSWRILGRRGRLSHLPPKRWGVEDISEEG